MTKMCFKIMIYISIYLFLLLNRIIKNKLHTIGQIQQNKPINYLKCSASIDFRVRKTELEYYRNRIIKCKIKCIVLSI